MDWVYVCALEYLIFNFVGSEMAETDGGVADLPAWDNMMLRVQSFIFLKCFSIDELGLCLRIKISNF